MNIYEKIGVTSNVAIVIISIAIMLFLGFLMTRITKKLKLPNVTAYITVGILIGPYVLNLIPNEVVKGMDFLPDIALAFIAFTTGEYFRVSVLKKNGLKVVIITVFESVLATVFVFLVTRYLLHMSLSFSIVLSALAAATAPASTMMTIRQTGAKGDFVDTLIQVVALDDIVGLVLYSMAISIAVASNSGGGISVSSIVMPIVINIGVVILGALFGVLMKLLMTKKRTTDNRLIIALALIFLFCGICAILDISPLLGCMSMGMVYINISDDDKLFKQLNYFSPPILLLFFVRSGVNFQLSALVNTSTLVGTTPLIVIGIIYFFVRIIGKYLGSFWGSQVAHKGKEVRNYLGLALIPQAGVAIGLAALGARTLGGEAGQALETIILASGVLYELIGPACAKLSLYLSKSYSTKLEDLIDVNMVKEDGTVKTPVEVLIERINKIKEQLPKQEELLRQEEIAFTEEAEWYYNANHRKPGLINRR